MTPAIARAKLREATGMSLFEAIRLVPDPGEPTVHDLAGMAMLGLLTSPTTPEQWTYEYLASRAYDAAEAMVRERARRMP